MNLRAFLSLRPNCSICQSSLSVFFHSRKKQQVSIKNNNLIAIMDLKTINKRTVGKIGYHIDLDDNSFYINFYTFDGTPYDNEVSLSLIKKFWDFEFYHGFYSVMCYCSHCSNYCYSSQQFKPNYKNNSIEELSLYSEFLTTYQPMQDGYKVIQLVNWHEGKESWVKTSNSLDLSDLDKIDYGKNAYFVIPLFKCLDLSGQEIFNKMNYLLTFI